MNRIVHNLILDMKSTIVQQTIDIQRYDTGRKLVITLSDNGSVYPIGEGCYAVFTATKPDGNILYNHCEIVENTIVFDLLKNPQVAAAEGEVRCEIRLYGEDGSLITSPCFDIVVDKTLYTDNIIESSSEFSALTKAIVANINATKAAEDAVEKAQLDVAEAIEQAENKVNQVVAEASTEINAVVVGAEGRINELTDYAKEEVNSAVEKTYAESSNALKGNASGAVIKLSDVSPLEHMLKVKMEAAEGIEFPTLKTYGKNLLDPALLVAAGGDVQEDGSIKFDPISKEHTVLYRGNGSTDRVTLSFDVQTAYDLSQEYGQRFRVFYQGSTQAVPLGSVISVGSFSHYSITTGAGRIVDRIELDYGNTKNPTWLKNVQFEVGVAETEYEPFRGAEYTPNADGTVDGVKSIYPKMMLKTNTDGVTIETEYNRDLNKAFQELLQRVAVIPSAAAVE